MASLTNTAGNNNKAPVEFPRVDFDSLGPFQVDFPQQGGNRCKAASEWQIQIDEKMNNNHLGSEVAVDDGIQIPFNRRKAYSECNVEDYQDTDVGGTTRTSRVDAKSSNSPRAPKKYSSASSGDGEGSGTTRSRRIMPNKVYGVEAEDSLSFSSTGSFDANDPMGSPPSLTILKENGGGAKPGYAKVIEPNRRKAYSECNVEHYQDTDVGGTTRTSRVDAKSSNSPRAPKKYSSASSGDGEGSGTTRSRRIVPNKVYGGEAEDSLSFSTGSFDVNDPIGSPYTVGAASSLDQCVHPPQAPPLHPGFLSIKGIGGEDLNPLNLFEEDNNLSSPQEIHEFPVLISSIVLKSE